MDLQHLIRATKGTRSFADLESACGGKLGAARWQQLAKGELRNFPAPSSIGAIATALHVSEKTVLLAIGVTLGINIYPVHARLADLFPPAADDLPDCAVTALRLTVDAMVQMHGVHE